MSYGEATKLFTTLSKLWRMFRKLCPCLRDLLLQCLTTQAGVKDSMMPETFCLFAQKGITLDTSCLLTMYYFSTPRELPTKMDTVEGIRWMGKIKGIIRVRCVEASLCSILLWASKVYQTLMQSWTKLKRTLKMLTRCKFVGECEAEWIKLVAFTKIRI